MGSTLDRSAPPVLEIGLTAADMRVTYATGAVGCDGISLEVPPGSVLAVLGRNGAGKTSLLRAISGFMSTEGVQSRGTVQLGGRTIKRSLQRSRQAGVVFVPERDKVFPALTVREHFRLVGVRGLDELTPLDFDQLKERWTTRGGFLSGGERQMLALALAWGQRPKVLLADELSLGLAPIIVNQLMLNVREMCERSGMSAILVEQDAAAALKVADNVIVLDHGAVVWEGASSETSPQQLAERYLGAA